VARCNAAEAALLIALSARLGIPGVRSEFGHTFGVLVLLDEKPIGLWGKYDDRYRFRTLANWEPLRIVETIDQALVETRRYIRSFGGVDNN
jgi:hypothetical protein